jgi:hypothetical protein
VTGKPIVNTTIMFPRLLRKAKEREEDEGGRDEYPSKHLEPYSVEIIVLPDAAWDLWNLGIVTVDGSPTVLLYTRLGTENDEKQR